MKYKIPTDDECIDILTDAEFKRYENDERGAVRCGRRKAWAEHRATGALAQLRDLALGSVGASTLFPQYSRASQLSVLVAQISLEESVQLSCRLERSLVDGSVIGVRVTLVRYTR